MRKMNIENLTHLLNGLWLFPPLACTVVSAPMDFVEEV
jgi:hypothetical protein